MMILRRRWLSALRRAWSWRDAIDPVQKRLQLPLVITSSILLIASVSYSVALWSAGGPGEPVSGFAALAIFHAASVGAVRRGRLSLFSVGLAAAYIIALLAVHDVSKLETQLEMVIFSALPVSIVALVGPRRLVMPLVGAILVALVLATTGIGSAVRPNALQDADKLVVVMSVTLGLLAWLVFRARTAIAETLQLLADQDAMLHEASRTIAFADHTETLGIVTTISVHDIRNALSRVSLNASGLLGGYVDDTRMAAHEVQEAVADSMETLDRLMSQMRREPEPRTVVSCRVCTAVIGAAAQRALGSGVRVRWESPDDLWVEASATHIEQIVWNLCMQGMRRFGLDVQDVRIQWCATDAWAELSVRHTALVKEGRIVEVATDLLAGPAEPGSIAFTLRMVERLAGRYGGTVYPPILGQGECEVRVRLPSCAVGDGSYTSTEAFSDHLEHRTTGA